MQNDLLIVEELMLLLLDDDGASISGAGTLHYTLGGAVLVELALLDRVELDQDSGGGFLNGNIVRPKGVERLEDPLLQEALEAVRVKDIRVQPLILTLGGSLRPVLLERLEKRGLISREQGRFLGIFRTTRWPAGDARHEEELRERIRAVLVEGREPDPRTAAVIGLVYASGAMPALRPPLPWNSTTVTRARKIQEGDWGADAVSDAVQRTAAAIAASSAAVAISAAASR